MTDISDFTGKSAIVTGAASGIGLAVANLLVDRGARVLAVDVDASALQARVRAGYIPFVADVSDSAQVRAYVERAVEEFGRVDHFFNNAGVEGVIKPVTEVTDEEWRRVLSINLDGVFYGYREVVRQMAAQGGGSIVATGSNVALTGAPNRVDYVTSKHAVLAMTRTVADEYEQHHVRANCICPGPVETPLMERAEVMVNPDDPAAVHADYAAISPMNRYARPAEIAELVLFLLSDRAEFINGVPVSIDGGFSAR